MKTPSHAIAQQVHPQIARLERTQPATIRLLIPSLTLVASSKSDLAAMRPILKISRDYQPKMVTTSIKMAEMSQKLHLMLETL
jgi:hypothetical protein